MCQVPEVKKIDQNEQKLLSKGDIKTFEMSLKQHLIWKVFWRYS